MPNTIPAAGEAMPKTNDDLFDARSRLSQIMQEAGQIIGSNPELMIEQISVSANGIQTFLDTPGAPRQSVVNINVIRHNLQLLSMHDLNIVMAAMKGARDAVNGIECQPRCTGAALTELSSLQDNMNEAIDMIADVAKEAKPATKDEAVIRAVLIMHHETEFHDEFECLEECFLSLKADMASFHEGEAA